MVCAERSRRDRPGTAHRAGQYRCRRAADTDRRSAGRPGARQLCRSAGTRRERGRGIEYSGDFLGPIPNLVVFQFNPEQIARTINIPHARAQTPHESARPREPASTGVPPTESFTITAHFSAADDLGKGGAASAIPRVFGIGPQLVALEKMVYPAGPLTGLIGAALDAIGSALGGGAKKDSARPVPRESVPRILFIWGLTRVLPVKIKTLTITEQKYDFLLNPVQAEVQIGLEINNLASTSTDKIGKGALTYSQVLKDAQSILNLAKSVELAAEIVPF
jgi:hypothetical protein